MTVCYFCCPNWFREEGVLWAERKKESNIASVMYSYVGTDDQFDEFLKLMLHDYLAVDNPYTNQTTDFVGKVESGVA